MACYDGYQKNIRFEYNKSQGKIYLVIYTGNSHVLERIPLDETRWENLLVTARKAISSAEENRWGKTELVIKAEEVLKAIRIDLEAEEREG